MQTIRNKFHSVISHNSEKPCHHLAWIFCSFNSFCKSSLMFCDKYIAQLYQLVSLQNRESPSKIGNRSPKSGIAVQNRESPSKSTNLLPKQGVPSKIRNLPPKSVTSLQNKPPKSRISL